jgi:hypothetical protein
MAYRPEERLARMKELMKPIDAQIMMCDDAQDLIALASIMITTSKIIYVQQLGVDGTKAILNKIMESLDNE